MKAPLVSFFLTLSLCIGILGKRGGGGGGSSSDEGDGGNGDSGNNGTGGDNGGDDKDDPQAKLNAACREEALFTSPLWLHRWVGMYYNGTIEISVSFTQTNVSCNKQPSAVTENFNGVLSLLDPTHINETADSGAANNPFIFTLYGWPMSTTSEDLLKERMQSTYLPPAVQLTMESLPFLRQFEGGKIPQDNRTESRDPTCLMGNFTKIDSGLEFSCQYDRSSVNNTHLEADPSHFSIPFRACGDADPQPFIAQNYAGTLLRGNFSQDAAAFSWSGQFKGLYQTGESEYLYGSFAISFRGSVDRQHSHEMVFSSTSESSVDWVENGTLTAENAFCAARSSGTATRALVSTALPWLFLCLLAMML